MKLDRTLINQLNSKRDGIVQAGKAAEKREQEGYTNDVLIKDAKTALGISEEDLIEAEFEAILKKQNLEVNGLLQLNSAVNSGAFEGETLEQLKKAEKELVKKVASVYDVEVEELYEEGEE